MRNILCVYHLKRCVTDALAKLCSRASGNQRTKMIKFNRKYFNPTISYYVLYSRIVLVVDMYMSSGLRRLK